MGEPTDQEIATELRAFRRERKRRFNEAYAKGERAGEIKALQELLDRYENPPPVPEGALTSRSFGSASGALEIAGLKRLLHDRLAELEAEEGENGR